MKFKKFLEFEADIWESSEDIVSNDREIFFWRLPLCCVGILLLRETDEYIAQPGLEAKWYFFSLFACCTWRLLMVSLRPRGELKC